MAKTRTDATPTEIQASDLQKIDRSQFDGKDMNDGFLPYYNPIPGDAIAVIPVGFDRRQEGFERIVFEACEDVRCFTGPKEDAEEVIVRAGEKFNTSDYAALRITEAFFGFMFLLKVKEKVKVASDKTKTVWLWELIPRSVDVPKIQASKDAYAKMLLDAERQIQKSA